MNRKQLTGIVIGVLFVAGAGIWAATYFSGSTDTATSVPQGEVQKQSLRISLLEEGTLQPYNYDKISIDTEEVREFQITELVSNGAHVNKGEVILRLDPSEIKRKIQDTKLDVESAQNNLLVAKEEKKKKLLNARMDIQEAKFQLELARKNLEKFNNLEDDKNRKEKKVKVKQAKVKLEKTRNELKAAKKMKKKGLISEAKLKRTRVDLEDAEFQLRKAKMEEKIYRKYTSPIDKTELENKVQRKKKQLESRKSFFEAVKSQKQSDVKEARAKLENAKEKLEQLQSDLDELKVQAPSTGIVNYGSPGGGRYSDDSDLEEGQTVRRGQTLMYIPDLDNMYVHVPVDEADISKLLASEESDTGQKTDEPAIQLSDIDRKTLISVFKKAGSSAVKQLGQKIDFQELRSAGSLSEAVNKLDENQKKALRSFLARHLETRSRRFKRLDAQITSESFPNAQITGTVDYVAGAASEESWWSDVKKFDTKIKLNEHYDWYRPGMNVKVEITVEETEPILTVPMDAIFSEEGDLFCFRNTGSGTFEKVFVRTNRSDGNYVEITDGALQEKDQVALARPDDAQVKGRVPLQEKPQTKKTSSEQTKDHS